MGEKAGLCGKYIAEIERSRKNPTVTVLMKIASALEVSAADLIEPEEDCLARQQLTAITKMLRQKDEAMLAKLHEVLKIVFE